MPLVVAAGVVMVVHAVGRLEARLDAVLRVAAVIQGMDPGLRWRSGSEQQGDDEVVHGASVVEGKLSRQRLRFHGSDNEKARHY